MATDISDLDALKKYLEEKNLTLVTGQEAGRQPKVLAPYQWKWEDIEPAVVASGQFVRLAEAQDHETGAPLGPFLRNLPGAEKVHLASGGARRPDLRRSLTPVGKHDGDDHIGWTEVPNSVGADGDSNGFTGTRAGR